MSLDKSTLLVFKDPETLKRLGIPQARWLDGINRFGYSIIDAHTGGMYPQLKEPSIEECIRILVANDITFTGFVMKSMQFGNVIIVHESPDWSRLMVAKGNSLKIVQKFQRKNYEKCIDTNLTSLIGWLGL